MATTAYKPIPEGDHEQFVRIDAHAFGASPAEARRWLAERHAGELRGLYEDRRLVAQAVLFSFPVLAGATTLRCGGLGGVATPPEQRRRGHIARLLRELSDELLAQNTALCLLIPFKTSFYRRFGWSTCMERRRYSGPPELFASFRRQLAGRFDLVGPEAVPELDGIYAGALRGRFGPVARTPVWWEKEVLTAHNKEVYTYLWRDEAGVGRSYLSFSLEQGPGGRLLACREIVALDPQARAQLFGLLANHEAQCQEVRFVAPADAPVNLLLPDPLKCEIEPYFMLRLLDVAGALGAQRYPAEACGRLTIAVADDWLAHNQGTFELEVDNGAATCRRLPDGAEADLACDVRVLTQLFTRYLRPRTAAAFGLLQAQNREALALADLLFAGLAPFSSDFF